MRDAFLAVDVATDLRAHARDLRRWWNAMFSGAAVTTSVRPVIVRWWSRMASAGLDPARPCPRAALTIDALADARASSPLRTTLPLRRHLGMTADDAERMMVPCDVIGRILWLEGHPRVLAQAKGIMFEPGVLSTERSAGTNAIGTALAIDHPVQVFSAEHILPEQRPWWCSESSLYDPVTSDLLGVVDLSGPQRAAHPCTLTLVTAAARIAEAALHERQLERDNRLRQTYLDRIRRSRGASSALIDERGRVLLAMPIWAMVPVGARRVTSRGAAPFRRWSASWVSGVVGTPAAPLLAAGAVTRALPPTVARRLGGRAHRRGTRRARGGDAPRGVDAGDDALWTWLDTDHGRDEVDAVHRFERVADPDDPRRGAAAARLRLLEAANLPART